MKKTLLIIAVAGLAMASCKKDRTCTCTVTPISETANGVSQPVGQPSTRVFSMTKVTKGGAACNSWTEKSTTSSSTNGANTTTYVSTDKGDCKLS